MNFGGRGGGVICAIIICFVVYSDGGPTGVKHVLMSILWGETLIVLISVPACLLMLTCLTR